MLDKFWRYPTFVGNLQRDIKGWRNYFSSDDLAFFAVERGHSIGRWGMSDCLQRESAVGKVIIMPDVKRVSVATRRLL